MISDKKHNLKLDSIRGFAVLGVIFFHAGISLFTGGYAGVDVFFVLSGFLVSNSIYGSLEKHSFNFFHFYMRRFKRIYPASITTVLISLLLAQLIFLPEELQELNNSALSFLFLNTDLWAANSVNYFGIDVDFKPLIHFWSLVIEIKYYIFLPILLFFGFKFLARKIFIKLLLVIFFSICLSVFFIVYYSSSSYYFSIIARSWQFLMGVCLCSIIRFNYDNKLSIFKNSLSLYIGYLLILIAYVMYDGESRFPGVLSLVPSVGAAILILNAYYTVDDCKTNLFFNLLSRLGIISFSLYLIHQPLFVFSRLLFNFDDNSITRIATISVSIVSSCILYYLVEKKFNKVSIYSLPLYVYCGIFTVFGGCLIFFKSNVLPIDAEHFVSFRYENNPRMHECRVTNKIIDPLKLCEYGNKSTTSRKYFIWGDSHVDQLVVPLSEVLTNYGYSLKEASIAGCPPILKFIPQNKERRCLQNNKIIYDYLINDKSITDVVLHAFWIGYFDNGLRSKHNDIQILVNSFSQMILDFEAKGKIVHVLYPVPQMNINPPLYLARRALLSNYVTTTLPTLTMDSFEFHSNKSKIFLDSALASTHASRIYLSEYLYDVKKNSFIFVSNNEVLYRDDNHLSLSGGRYIANNIVDKLISGVQIE